MAMPSFLSAVVLANGQPDELDGALANLLNQDRQPEEIVVFDLDPRGSGRKAPHIDDPLVQYFAASEPTTPVRGRNLAAAKARGDILLFLHEYARYDKYLVTNTVMSAFRAPEVAGAAFQVRDSSNHELIPDEYPGLNKDKWADAREVCGLSPATFAFRRSMFQALGGYDEMLSSPEAEIDLALRAIKEGWRIRYLNDILAYVRASVRWKEEDSPVYRLLRNRLYLALKHYPAPLVVTHSLLWGLGAFVLALQHGAFGDFTRALNALKADGLTDLAARHRQAYPTSYHLINYLSRHEGRVLF